LWSVNNLPLFTLAGFTFLTTYVGITGPDFTGRDVTGIGNLSGNGYNVDIAYWDFRSPPCDIGHFDHDITGPINLQFFAFFENGHVPDSGSTRILMGIGCRSVPNPAFARTRLTVVTGPYRHTSGGLKVRNQTTPTFFPLESF